MQAFCRHSTSRRRLAGQGPGRYIGLDGMDGPAGAGTTGRHGLWASCSCSYSSTCGSSSSNKVAASKKRQSQVTSHPCSGQVRAEGGPGHQVGPDGEREGCVHGFWSLGTTQHKGKAGDPRPTRPTKKWTAKQAAATGRASSRQEGTRGPTVERCERCSVTELSHQTFTVQKVGKPKTHMGRHWPPAPDCPGLCDDTSSISRKVVYFVSPFLSFLLALPPPRPGPGPAQAAASSEQQCLLYARTMLLLVESMHPYCPATLHYHTAPPRC